MALKVTTDYRATERPMQLSDLRNADIGTIIAGKAGTPSAGNILMKLRIFQWLRIVPKIEVWDDTSIIPERYDIYTKPVTLQYEIDPAQGTKQ